MPAQGSSSGDSFFYFLILTSIYNNVILMVSKVRRVKTMKQLFKLGQCVCTRGVNESMKADEYFRRFVNRSFLRHQTGDWGDLCDEDKELNDLAVKNGDDRILSRYAYNTEMVIYIITEWDRSYTTILFTDEY